MKNEIPNIPWPMSKAHHHVNVDDVQMWVTNLTHTLPSYKLYTVHTTIVGNKHYIEGIRRKCVETNIDRDEYMYCVYVGILNDAC